MSGQDGPLGGYNRSYPSRPRSKKVKEEELDLERERLSDEDREPKQEKEFVPLKVLWKQKSKHPRNGNEHDRFKPGRKIQVIAPHETPKPITRRTRMESFVNEGSPTTEKKTFLGKFKRNKQELSRTMFSMVDINSVVLDDIRASNLPEDFEYDLKMYNSPQSKPIKTSSGRLTLAAHPCYESNPDREELYRTGREVKQEIPTETNMNLEKRLSAQLREMLKTPALPRVPKGRERDIPAVPPKEKNRNLDAQPPLPPPKQSTLKNSHKASNRSRPLPPIVDMPKLRKVNRPSAQRIDIDKLDI